MDQIIYLNLAADSLFHRENLLEMFQWCIVHSLFSFALTEHTLLILETNSINAKLTQTLMNINYPEFKEKYQNIEEHILRF